MKANGQASIEAALAAVMLRHGLDQRAWEYLDARTVADMRLRAALRKAGRSS